MTKAKLTFLLGAGLVIGATMCQYDPNPKSGEVTCSDSGKCPSGYKCYLETNKCYRPEDWPQTPPSTGGTTATTSASTTAKAGASGGASVVIASSKTVTGGQTGGATSSEASALTSVGGDAGSSVSSGGAATGGTSAATTSSRVPPSGTTVSFVSGKAVGAMTGYGWVALAAKDVLTDPTCGPDKARYAPGVGCSTYANWNVKDALCISGSIPAVDPVALDYEQNWGFAIGVSATEDVSGTLSRAFSSIAFTVTGSPTSGLQATVHRKGDIDSINYCATPLVSGKAIPLTSFNTKCYDNPPDGIALKAADVPNIDKLSVQVNSNFSPITVSNLCLTGITFTN